MVLEVVTAQIKSGQEAAFEAAFQEASTLIAGASGHISHELRRCLEVQGKYLIMIRWNTVDDHMVGFRGWHSKRFGQSCHHFTNYHHR